MEKSEIYELMQWLAFDEDRHTRPLLFVGWLFGKCSGDANAQIWHWLRLFKDSLTGDPRARKLTSIDEAMRVAREFEKQDIVVTNVMYDASGDSIFLAWKNRKLEATGTCLIARRLLQGLEDATAEQLSRIEISPSGCGLSWPDLDVDHYVPGLMNGVFGTKAWMDALE